MRSRALRTRSLLALAASVTVLLGGAGRAAAEDKLGTVAFATSCAPAAHALIQRGVAQLHSFWFGAARQTFQAALAADPACAIATWGTASVLMGNPFGGGGHGAHGAEDLAKARAALDRGRAIGARTERERDYLEAVAAYYRDAARPEAARLETRAAAFEALARKHPQDFEAQAFHALYLACTQSLGDRTYAATLRATEILERLFAQNPDHPGVAHYLIHAYDYPPLAARGLPAARRYASIAPVAPHALHMPSHIFTRVGAWAESAATNRRAAAAARADRDLGGVAHSLDYMAYAALQLARDGDARRAVEETAGLAGSGNLGGAYAVLAVPARYAVERGAWREAAQLAPRTSHLPYAEALTHFARALGAARAGDPKAAEADVQRLAALRDALKTAHNDYWATEVEVSRLAASGWVRLAQGQKDEAVRLARAAADLEDASDKHITTPGRLLPARELLGELLLELGRPAEALREFEASHTREPDRLRGLHGAGHAAAQAGDMARRAGAPGEASGYADKARRYYARLVEVAGQGDGRPELAAARAYLAGR